MHFITQFQFLVVKLQDSVNSLSHNVAPDAVEGVKNRIKLIQDQLNKCKDDLYNMKDLADSSEKYWRKIEEARNHFVDEIESLFPGVNLSDKKMDLSKDELDLFFVHAYSYVMAYRKELEKMHAEGEARIRRALDALRSDDKSEAMKQQLEYDIEKEKQLLRLQNQKELFKQQAVNDKLLRDQLRRQAEAHVDHIKNALTVKEKELRRQFERELHEKVSAEQMAYKQQLAGMIGKLKGMDAAIQGIKHFMVSLIVLIVNCVYKLNAYNNILKILMEVSKVYFLLIIWDYSIFLHKYFMIKVAI